MTFLELQTDTKRRIREATDSGIYFADQDIAEAINAGYHELSDASEWLEEFLDIALLKDRPYYDLFSIIGQGFLSVKPAFDTSRNRWLIPSTVRELEQRDPRWERVTGSPEKQVLRGLRWMGLYPRTTSEGTDRIRQYYTRLPEPLCEDDDEPGFPEDFHVGCEYFALADLFAQDGETTLALGAWQDYLAVESALIAWVNGRTDRPMTRVIGGGAG